MHFAAQQPATPRIYLSRRNQLFPLRLRIEKRVLHPKWLEDARCSKLIERFPCQLFNDVSQENDTKVAIDSFGPWRGLQGDLKDLFNKGRLSFEILVEWQMSWQT